MSNLIESKTCEVCKEVFCRHENERTEHWSRRRFCSVLCRNRKNTQFRTQDFCSRGHPYRIVPSGKYCPICVSESGRRKYRERHPPPITPFDPKTQTKLCGCCKVRKSITEFHRRNDQANRVDKWAGYCIACGSQKYRDWHEKNKEHKAAYGKTFYEQNIDTIRQYDADRWLNGKKERLREIRSANRDRYNGYGHAHRARKLKSPGKHFNADDVERIKTYQRERCAICRKKIIKYHIDHITPLAKGGTNEAKNIQLLCRTCNVRKSQTDQITFIQRRGLLL